MATSAIYTHGQSNAAGSQLALFNKLATQEVLAAFRRETVTAPIPFMRRTITGGQTAQIKVTARTTAQGHVRGGWVVEDNGAAATPYLQNPKVGEVVIGLDRALVTGTFYDELDDLMAPESEQIRTEFAFQAGEAIARTYDRRRLINIAQGAVAVSDPYNTDMPGGTVIDVDNSFTTTGTGLVDTRAAIRQMAASFDNKYVRRDMRYMVVEPDVYYWMVENFKEDVISTDYRGEGSVAQGKIHRIFGFEILTTTQLPKTNITSDGPDTTNQVIHPVNDYRVDASNFRALFFTPEAVGIVSPGGMGEDPTTLTMETPDRLGTLMFAKAYSGSKFLRPACCGAIRELVV